MGRENGTVKMENGRSPPRAAFTKAVLNGLEAGLGRNGRATRWTDLISFRSPRIRLTCGYLPTSYGNSQQLDLTIPASLLVNPGLLPISVFDASSNQFSTDSLTFTVTSAAPTNGTQLKAIDLAGLAMAWDASSGLLYVGTADYDGAYPNSIVAIDGNTGSVVKVQTVSPDPDLVNVSANGQYLYAA